MALESFIKKFGGLTEQYWFYDKTEEIRYDVDAHVYLKAMPDGSLLELDGVTNVCHIVDKSQALIPWAVKMMYQKLLRTIPTHEVRTESTFTLPDSDAHAVRVQTYISPMTFAEFDKIALEAKGAHKEKLEDAGAVGHIAHAWIEDYIKLSIAKKEPQTPESYREVETKLFAHMAKYPEDERARNACIAALDWMNRHDVRWLSTEKKIYSRKYGYAGTMDGLCLCNSCTDPLCCPDQFNDRLSVADWKTSNYLYLEYLFQTAAYEAAYEEEFGVDIKDRWIIRLGKEDGEFEAWHLEENNFEDDFGGFLDALDMTRRVKNIQARIAARKADIRSALKAERDRARALQEALEQKQRLEAREKRQQERVEALRLACGYASKYKGVRKPTCTSNYGEPCESCAETYKKRQAERPVRQSNIGAFPHGETTWAGSMTAQPNSTTQAESITKSDNQDLQPPVYSESLAQFDSLLAVLTPKPQPIQLPASSGTPVSATGETSTESLSAQTERPTCETDDRIPYPRGTGENTGPMGVEVG